MADEKLKYNNLKTALGDPKTRLIYIVGIILVFAVAIFAVYTLKKKTMSSGEFPADEVAPLPAVKKNEPVSDSQRSTPAYQKLIKAENKEEATKAKESGGSALPVLQTAPAQPEHAKADQAHSQPQPKPDESPTETPESRHEEEQKRQLAIKDRLSAMKGQVNLLITSWSPKVHVNLPVVGKADSQQGAITQSVGVSASGVPSTNITRKSSKKAGETCYAELDTFVNTDEPSPVFATIQQCGELDQSILIGKAEIPQNAQYAQKAVLHFTTINVPGQPNSQTVDVVAIDEATRRTALATDVDNHYFLRYGALFGASFLSGFGDALLKGGQNQSIVTTTTGAIVQNTAYNTRQMALAGLGNVGKQLSTNMSGLFNRPSTITIDDKKNPGAHIGIGIVFMSDLTLK